VEEESVTKGFLEERLRTIEEAITKLVLAVTPIPLPDSNLSRVRRSASEWYTVEQLWEYGAVATDAWWLIDWDTKDPSRLGTWFGKGSAMQAWECKPARVARIYCGS
jgi:hypothetical protein